MGVILGILMFMTLVLLHELGHFINAKRSWVKVLEFGIGIPPKVMTLWKDKSGTHYTLNLLPLGWFVRLKGEDPKIESDFRAKDSFIKASIGNKIVILLAWVGMNLLIARAIFTTIFTLGTQPISMMPENALLSTQNSYLMPTRTFLYTQWYISEEVKRRIEEKQVVVSDVSAGSLSETLGIATWDIITQINDAQVNWWNLSSVLKRNIGGKISLTYIRNGKSKTVNGTCAQDSCMLGIAFSASNGEDLSGVIIKFPFITAMRISAKEIKSETVLTVSALGRLGADLLSLKKARIKTSLNKLTGPVWAIKLWETLLTVGGFKLYLGFAGIISLALAIFNVLPIPALDWGRLLGVIIQGLWKLKPEKYFTIEGYINLFFFILLMMLWVYILLKDLVNFRDIRIPFLG